MTYNRRGRRSRPPDAKREALIEAIRNAPDAASRRALSALLAAYGGNHVESVSNYKPRASEKFGNRLHAVEVPADVVEHDDET